MIYEKEDEVILYEKSEDDSICINRVFGKLPFVIIPARIGNASVTTIGKYCFAPKASLSEAQRGELEQRGLGDGMSATNHAIRPICGNFLETVILPETVTTLHPYAFYNCRKLESLKAGSALRMIENDAFMNCKNLHSLKLVAEPTEATGLRILLNQLASEVEVAFLGKNADTSENSCKCSVSDKHRTEEMRGTERILGKILYPEYQEGYEEIGPAHIFALHVEGEGYRARKQFENDKIDYAGYDAVFEKASNEESFDTLMRMAVDRLLYPIALSVEHRTIYLDYVKYNSTRILKRAVEREDTVLLENLIGSGLMQQEAIRAAIETAIERGWTRGTAQIVRLSACVD